MRRRFTKTDLCFIAALAVVCLAVAVFFYARRGEESGWVVVTRGGEEYGRYLLAEKQTVEITDGSGEVTNVLVISEGSADMTEADCPDRLCVHQRAICRAGESIVCLPNQVVVTVESGEEGELDGFAQ